LPQQHQIFHETVSAQSSLCSYSHGVLLVFLTMGSSRIVREVMCPPTILVFVEN